MPSPRTPPQRWQATSGWWLRRIVATLTPLLAIGWVALAMTDNTGMVVDRISALGGAHRVGFVPIWFVAVAALVVIAAVGGGIAGRVRRRAARRTAAALGLHYVPDDPAFATRWDTAPFGRGRGRRAYDVLSGRVGGRPCAMFSYRFTTGSGEHSTTTVLSVVTVGLGYPLPPMSVSPEGLVGMVAPGLTPLDIDVEDEGFNRYHRVSAQSREYAVAMLNPRAVEALVAVPPFAWQVIGSDLVATGPQTSVDTLRTRAEALAGVADNVPGFLRPQPG